MQSQILSTSTPLTSELIFQLFDFLGSYWGLSSQSGPLSCPLEGHRLLDIFRRQSFNELRAWWKKFAFRALQGHHGNSRSCWTKMWHREWIKWFLQTTIRPIEVSLKTILLFIRQNPLNIAQSFSNPLIYRTPSHWWHHLWLKLHFSGVLPADMVNGSNFLHEERIQWLMIPVSVVILKKGKGNWVSFFWVSERVRDVEISDFSDLFFRFCSVLVQTFFRLHCPFHHLLSGAFPVCIETLLGCWMIGGHAEGHLRGASEQMWPL